MSRQHGYYSYPTIHADTIVFACEDDLWRVPASGGVARRLTANPGQAYAPALSPDGTRLAFTGRDEGHAEVYIMPAEGGPATRLTYLGADARVVGWTPDGKSVVFVSNAGTFFFRIYYAYTISPEGGEPARLPAGPALTLSYHLPGGDVGQAPGLVIGRHMADIATWKRYRGGRTGDIWIDPSGAGDWRRLIQLRSNVAAPLWIGERVYFVSDHEGIGNLYSCLPSGAGLRRHTHHTDYYVRRPATDGKRIVYHAGADLYIFDPATHATQQVDVAFHSPQAQRKRKFVDAARYLQSYDLHPEGHSVALTAAARPFRWRTGRARWCSTATAMRRATAWRPGCTMASGWRWSAMPAAKRRWRSTPRMAAPNQSPCQISTWAGRSACSPRRSGTRLP